MIIPTRKVRIGVIGRPGVGKSHTVLSVFKALFAKKSEEFIRPRLSRRARRLLEALGRTRTRPDRTPPVVTPETAEELSFVWVDGPHAVEVEFVSYPGELLYRLGALDADGLRAWKRAEQLDFLIFAENPHELFTDLGGRALEGVAAKSFALGRPLGEAVLTAAEVVFGRNADGVRELRSGFEELPAAVAGCVATKAGRAKGLAAALAREGLTADDIAAVERVLELIVQSCTAFTGETALIRDLLRHDPRSLVLFSHIDLADWAGLSPSDYAAAAAELRPTQYDGRVSDVVMARQLHLELLAPPRDAVFLRGLLPDGGAALWEALKPRIREWRDTPRPAADPAPLAFDVDDAPPRRSWFGRVRDWAAARPVAAVAIGGLAAWLAVLAVRLVFGSVVAEAVVLAAIAVGLVGWWLQSRAARPAPRPAVRPAVPPAVAARASLNGVRH